MLLQDTDHLEFPLRVSQTSVCDRPFICSKAIYMFILLSSTLIKESFEKQERICNDAHRVAELPFNIKVLTPLFIIF